MQKIDFLHKRCTELFAEMKRHERESIKHKKRSDQVQKDKDVTRTELTKTTTLKDKLEKLCRELQKENNKLKVPLRTRGGGLACEEGSADDGVEREQNVIGHTESERTALGREVLDAATEA